MVLKTFSASSFFGLGFEEPARNSSTFLKQNQIWSVHDWLQKQQMVTLVKVFGTGWKETSFSPLFLKKADLTGTKRASPNLPAGAAKIPPVTWETAGNRYLRRILPASAGFLYLRISLAAAFAGDFAGASFTVKGSPAKFFGTVRQQIFNRKSWYFPLRHKVFRYPKLSATQMGSSAKFFGNVRGKNINGKSWYPFAKSTEISGGIDVCKNSLKTNIKRVVLFLTVCKSWSKYL